MKKYHVLFLLIPAALLASGCSLFAGKTEEAQQTPRIANPASVKAAITLLTHRAKNSILVFGDMLELGNIADEQHADIGIFAKNAGIKKLFCYGKLSAQAAKTFGENAQHFDNHDALIESLKPQLQKDTTVLIKGSRGMKMEKVVEALCYCG